MERRIKSETFKPVRSDSDLNAATIFAGMKK